MAHETAGMLVLMICFVLIGICAYVRPRAMQAKSSNRRAHRMIRRLSMGGALVRMS